VESAFDGEDLKSSLKRSQFEELNEKIFSKLTFPIEEVISYLT
jgi:hypoxia up-regulated 1